MYDILWLRFDQRDVFLLWRWDDPEGVVVDSQGRVLAYETYASVNASVAGDKLGVHPAAPTRCYDLDTLQSWIISSEKAVPDPAVLLVGWNLLLDVAAAVHDVAYVKTYAQMEHLYVKLCRMCSPLHSGANEVQWTPDDIDMLRNVLAMGIAQLRAQLQPASF